jgi:hypothetical protein
MNKIVPTLSVMVLVGSLAGSVFAADGVLLKDEAGENYCHMKFPANAREPWIPIIHN